MILLVKGEPLSGKVLKPQKEKKINLQKRGKLTRLCINMYIHLSICINTTVLAIMVQKELAIKLVAAAYVAQSVERWSRDPGSLVQFPARGLGVAFFATGPGWVSKFISFKF